METETILKELQTIKSLLNEINSGSSKEVLNFEQAYRYIDSSPSYLYKLTSKGLIPHYKPKGKKIYFKKDELDQWLLSNKVYSQDEIEQEANNYIKNKQRGY